MTTIKLSGIDYELTAEKQRRIIEAITETNMLLDNEQKYSDDLQDKDMINFYHEHIRFLSGLLQ